MRWLFLLLLVLNVFYYVWHQQEAPLRAKDVTPLSLYKGSQQDIRLLSESVSASRSKPGMSRIEERCLYLGGFAREEQVMPLSQRLAEMDIKAELSANDVPAAGYWLRIAPESQRLLGDAQLQNLSKEFNELKHKIMLCEGVAPAE
ncbi:hypothetical protein PSH79_24865 [Pseudomonas sp. FP2196]|uniref:hypothetical protein n=1 Tax=Pseudomonas sp. FP2196 TaxID=2954086 RepID=UPI002732A64B|nr:hypothetical protein [Pseudomonas sp. FP2196]WLH35111.1 hypothetical protein PSH79_24865 [Pseudomonas sp. FP2196]